MINFRNYIHKLNHIFETEVSCDTGLDLVFVLDYTGSMSGVIENIKANIASIVSEIVSVTGDDYRLGLVLADEYIVGQESPYEISLKYTGLPASYKYDNNGTPSRRQLITAMQKMSNNNQAGFINELNAINTPAFLLGFGAGTFEPTDLATSLVIREDFAGSFRAGAFKLVIIITDADSSGDDDASTAEDDAFIDALVTDANNDGINIALIKTNAISMPNLEELALDTSGVVQEDGDSDTIIQVISEIC